MKRKTILCSIFFLPLILLLAGHAGDRKTSHPLQQQVVSGYGNLPLSFEINRGQTDKHVDFLSHGSGYSLFLTANEAVFVLNPGGKSAPSLKSSAAVPARKNPAAPSFELAAMHRPALPTSVRSSSADLNATSASTQRAAAVLRMKLLGANATPKMMGLQELPGKSNYFIGNDPKKWRTNVPNYGKVKYADVYPGVDLVYYGNQRQLEYDFVVEPGASPQQIALQIVAPGVGRSNVAETALHSDGNGELIVDTAVGEVRFHKPVVYQVNDDGAKNYVEGRYLMASLQTGVEESKVGFEVGQYDRSKPLVIDPTLVYSTFFDDADGTNMAVDQSGNAYLTGSTFSASFPVTPDAFQRTGPVLNDAFVTKLNVTGSALVYSTFLGGTKPLCDDPESGCPFDAAYGIAVDADGNAYVSGATSKLDFPTTPDAFTRSGETGGGFITKLNPTGSALVYSTLLRGLGSGGGAIAVDREGNAYVTGPANSDLPTTPGAFQTSIINPADEYGFVAKLNVSGSALIYSTFLGPMHNHRNFYMVTQTNAITVDSVGSAYVTGWTNACEPLDGCGSVDFPTTPGSFQTSSSNAGLEKAFVTKLNPAGSALVYSTFLDGSNSESGNGIAVDAEGRAYVTGRTNSLDFPTTEDAFQKSCGPCTSPYYNVETAFVTELNSTGSALIYSTYLGGSVNDSGNAIALDAAGDAYVTGFTSSPDFPTTYDAFQTNCRNCTSAAAGDVFVVKLSKAHSVVDSTFVGPAGPTETDTQGVQSIGVDAQGGVYLEGSPWADFPLTPDAYETKQSDFGTIFVTKFNFGIGPPTDKDQCKKGGWETFTIPRKFKNQGECVSYVETKK